MDCRVRINEGLVNGDLDNGGPTVCIYDQLLYVGVWLVGYFYNTNTSWALVKKQGITFQCVEIYVVYFLPEATLIYHTYIHVTHTTWELYTLFGLLNLSEQLHIASNNYIFVRTFVLTL